MRAEYLMTLACQRLTDNKEKSGFSYSPDDERERVGRFAFSDMYTVTERQRDMEGGEGILNTLLEKESKGWKAFLAASSTVLLQVEGGKSKFICCQTSST